MPPLPDAPNVIRVAVQGTIGGGTWANVFHVGYTGSPISQTDLASFLNSFDQQYWTTFGTLMSTGTSIRSLKGADLSSPASAQAQITVSHDGGRAGGSLPNSIACVVSWRVNYRWRGGHARTYVPIGVTTDVQQGRNWTAAFEQLVESAGEAFRSGVGSIVVGSHSFGLDLIRYYSGGQLLPVPLALPIVGSTVHSRIDSQRRRTGKEPI